MENFSARITEAGDPIIYEKIGVSVAREFSNKVNIISRLPGQPLNYKVNWYTLGGALFPPR